jgi:uncharacterized membrane protein
MKNKVIFLFLGAVLFFMFLSPPAIFAQEVINKFEVNLTAHKDGKMTVEENIEYDFGSLDRHGIYRTIPLVSPVGNLFRVIKIDFEEIKRDGKSEKYEVDLRNKETEVKIGDADKTISGPHTYYIKYIVENGIGSNYEDHDEIYWNATGNDWEIPINFASITINTDFGVSQQRVACFTRSANFNAQFCTFPNGNSFNPINTTAVLQPGDGLTTVSAFPLNTFPKSILQKNEPFWDPDFINFIKFYIPVVLIANFILAPYLLFWYFKRKSKERLGSPSVNFDIPKDANKKIISPAEAGIIDNTRLERNDVIATIFDLAIRKYIKLEEVKKVKSLRPDETDYKIIKLKEYEVLEKFERHLLDRIFEGGAKETNLTDLKKDFYLTFSYLEKDVFESLIQRRFYIKNPKTQMGFLLVFGLIALFTLNIILGPVLIFLSRKLNGRTQTGDKIDWQLDGLKIFLKNMSRHHKWQAKNLITVEKYIPYAMAFGMHDDFMKQLKVVYPNYNPSWYSGSSHNFYNSYSGIYSSMNSNVTTSAPSSSSGFSSGSSGGGGGGGGGGSW